MSEFWKVIGVLIFAALVLPAVAWFGFFAWRAALGIDDLETRIERLEQALRGAG